MKTCGVTTYIPMQNVSLTPRTDTSVNVNKGVHKAHTLNIVGTIEYTLRDLNLNRKRFVK